MSKDGTHKIVSAIAGVKKADKKLSKTLGTFDVPYVVLGACIHGGLAVLLACPYAIRVLDLPALC